MTPLSEQPADIDRLFDCLADEHRRRLLAALAERDTPSEIHLSEVVHGVDVDPDSLLIQLYHNHLPRLVDAGFVRWERGSAVVQRGPRFDVVRPFLNDIGGRSPLIEQS